MPAKENTMAAAVLSLGTEISRLRNVALAADASRRRFGSWAQTLMETMAFVRFESGPGWPVVPALPPSFRFWERY